MLQVVDTLIVVHNVSAAEVQNDSLLWGLLYAMFHAKTPPWTHGVILMFAAACVRA